MHVWMNKCNKILFVFETVSLCSLGSPRAHQKTRGLPASVSRVLGLKVHTTSLLVRFLNVIITQSLPWLFPQKYQKNKQADQSSSTENKWKRCAEDQQGSRHVKEAT